MNGAISKIPTSLANDDCQRQRNQAIGSAIETLIADARNAKSTELNNVVFQLASKNICKYQSSENPCGGKTNDF